MKEPRRTPQGEARALAQRERILTAAQKCFVDHGFHAASMALICAQAQMSAGLLYRYFAGKDEIILAIIERQLEENRSSIAMLRSGADLVDAISQLFARWRRGDPDVATPVLFLEISAEAWRNPKVGEALARSDRLIAQDITLWLTSLAREEGRELTADELRTQHCALRCFIEGSFVRAVREPDLDPRLIAESLQQLLMHMLGLNTLSGQTG